MSLSELREKDVVNVDTGKKLGKVMDIEFCVSTGCVQAIVVPGQFKVGNLFKGERSGVVIPGGGVVRSGVEVGFSFSVGGMRMCLVLDSCRLRLACGKKESK